MDTTKQFKLGGVTCLQMAKMLNHSLLFSNLSWPKCLCIWKLELSFTSIIDWFLVLPPYIGILRDPFPIYFICCWRASNFFLIVVNYILSLPNLANLRKRMNDVSFNETKSVHLHYKIGTQLLYFIWKSVSNTRLEFLKLDLAPITAFIFMPHLR